MIGFASSEEAKITEQVAHRVGHVALLEGVVERPEVCGCAVGQQGIDGEDVVAHDAVADRARAAGIVAGHAADRGPARGRDVDRKPQAGGLDLTVEVIHDDAGLDPCTRVFEVSFRDPVEILRGVDDQRPAHGLARLRRATATREHADAFLAGHGERCGNIGLALGDHDADWLDLVDRCVGGVASTTEAVEQDVAFDLAREPFGQAMMDAGMDAHDDVLRRRQGDSTRAGTLQKTS